MNKIIYYDIETFGLNPKEDIRRNKNRWKAKRQGIITSVAFKEQNKPTKCFTIGVNCKNHEQLLESIKPYFKDENNVLIGWNSYRFDDPVVKAHIRERNFKCKVFDLMQGYSKFVTHKSESLALNNIAGQLGKSKDDINPVLAFKEKEYKLLHDYNIKDVDLLEDIDKKYHITEIVETIMDTTGIEEPSKLLYVTAPLQSYIDKNNIKLGGNNKNKLMNFGGLNYYRNKGRWDNLNHFDVRSFYPYMFICLNASSNLNYDNLKTIELTTTEGLKQYGNLWFNNDGTIQVKKNGDSFKGIKLESDFNIKNGNGDIKDLVSELVDYKNNTEGDLRNVYKLLVNGLYGALDSEYFNYKHKNLSSACTFMCRLVLYRCIKEFKGVYAKTDSIWCRNATEETLNKFTADVLKEYGLNTVDTDDSYLIQWELESNVDTLFIKDKNNYLECINGEWKEKGSFEVPMQKQILYDYIKTPNLNINKWVKNHLTDIRGWCQFKTLSEKQTHHITQDVTLSDELGCKYEYGFKNYRYYTDQGKYLNTIELDDKLPGVDFDYAMNLATKKLKEYGFKVKIHKFKPIRPKKKTTNKTSDIGKITNLDDFNKPLRFSTLGECLKVILDDYEGNTLKLALMGTAFKEGYNICPTYNNVQYERGVTTSDKLCPENNLKDDGYGYTKLKEIIGEELAGEFVRLYKQDLKPIKKLKTSDKLMDRIRPTPEDKRRLDEIIAKYSLKNKKQELYYHFNLGEWKVNLKNTKASMINYNFNNSLHNLKPYIETDPEANQKQQKQQIQKGKRKVRKELQEIYDRLQAKIGNELSLIVEDYTYDELLNLFKETWPNTIFPLEPLLEEMAILMGNHSVMQAILGDSGNGKSSRTMIELNTLPNVLLVDRLTIAAISRNVQDYGEYYLDNAIVIYNDVGDTTVLRRDFEEVYQSVFKKLYSDGYVHSDLVKRNSDDVLHLDLMTPNSFKLIYNTVKPIFNKDNDQTASRTQTYTIPELSLEDRKNLAKKGEPITGHDPRYFKYVFQGYMTTKTFKGFKEEELHTIIEKAYEDNNNKVNMHKDGDLMNICKQMSILYGEQYYERFYKPKILESKTLPRKALELKAIIAKMVQISYEYDEVMPLRGNENNYVIAKTQSAYTNKSKYEFDAFTIKAVESIPNNFIKENKLEISKLLNILKDNGEIDVIGHINNYNVYVLLQNPE